MAKGQKVAAIAKVHESHTVAWGIQLDATVSHIASDSRARRAPFITARNATVNAGATESGGKRQGTASCWMLVAES